MKMWRMTATALLACLSASYADPLQDEDPSCDFRGLRLREELSRVLARLANVPAMLSQELSPYFPGLEIAEFTLEGMDGLILYGPITPYCINGTRMLQVDFINDGRAITLSLPWKTCSGHEGLFKVRATLFRFTAQFRVMGSSGEGVKLETTSRIVPVVTQDLRAFVEGAGPEVREASEMLSALLPGLLEELWYWQFSFEFDRRFRQATQ